jgi:hypothetical protein
MSKKSILIRIGVVALAVLLAILLASYFFIFVPFQKVQKRIVTLKTKASEIKQIATQNDIDLIATKTAELRKEFEGLRQDSKAFEAFIFVPHVRDYFAALEAGDFLFSAGSQAIQAIAPIADLLGLKKDGEGKSKTNLYELTTEQRLETALLTIDELMKKIDPISADVAKAKAKIDTVDPERYPKKLGSMEIRSQIENAKDQFDGMYRLLVNAQPFLKQLPTILGNKEEMRYLIIFQNDKERRATGGFWTGTTELTIEKGKFEFAGATNS